MITYANSTPADRLSLDDMVAAINALRTKMPLKTTLWAWSMMPPGYWFTPKAPSETIVLAHPDVWRSLPTVKKDPLTDVPLIFPTGLLGFPIIDLDNDRDEARRAGEVMRRHFLGTEGTGL